ncbi:MAG: response regulator transcription factor, partial [Pseudonocardia sp.]|nr:response regulator transcription factor [Pseudonocardia sp.]
MRAADPRLEPASWRARRGEVELESSTRDFALPRFFLAHPGQVLTRSHIREHVWDYGYEGYPTSSIVGEIGRQVRDQLMPARRPRTSPRVVKRAISNYVTSSTKGRRRGPRRKAAINIHPRRHPADRRGPHREAARQASRHSRGRSAGRPNQGAVGP